MNKKTTGIVAYITFLGWIVAFCAGDKEGAKFHLNQALVVWIAFFASSLVNVVLGFIPFGSIVGWIIYLLVLVCFIMGLIYACQDEEKEIPVLGQIKILK